MTDFKALYNQKKMTADEVAAQVESGWLIGMDSAIAQTPAIMDAVCRRAEGGALQGVRVQFLLDSYPFAFLADDSLAGKITGQAWFASSGARKALAGGWADYIPNYYRDCPRHIRANYDYDAFCVSVSPMDKHGYFSLGTVSSYSPAMIDKAKRIFVEVNDNTPRAVCGAQLHISQITGLVENSFELPTLPPAKLDETSITIGNLIAEQIQDGSCIQLGIGAIPDAVGLALKQKHDLGIHTEMFTSSMVDLIECGAVNNSKKQILEVDLFGQVCAESIGTKIMSGSGGQVDYVRGACQSKGGKSFIAFTSTAKGGTISKIKPILTPGAVVTTSKNDVDYIVTEYGLAHLRGEPLSSRVRQLIAIAHPDFRDELRFEAKKRGILI